VLVLGGNDRKKDRGVIFAALMGGCSGHER